MLPNSPMGLLAGRRCLLAEDLNSLPCGHLYRASHTVAAADPPGEGAEERGEKEQDQSQSFCNLISKMISHHFCCALLVTSESLILAQKDSGDEKTVTSGFLTHFLLLS